MSGLSTRIPRALAAVSTAQPARAVVFVALYVAVTWVSFVYPMRDLNITPWNPQSALAVGLLLWRPRAWWLVCLAVASGDALVPAARTPWSALFVSSLMLTAGYAAVAAALTRWARVASAVVTRREIVLFFLIVTAGALLASILRVAGLAAFGEVPPERLLTAIHRGAIGDGVGLLVTLPLLLLLGSRERRASTRAMFGTMEWWLIVGAGVLATVAVFARPADEHFKFFYLLFLPVVWASGRFGVGGAVWSAVIVQITMIAAIHSAAYRSLTVFELQLLMAVLAATGLLLGATVDEREEADRTLRASLRLAAAGDMAAALAHELNQPLTAMSTYAHASQVLVERIAQDEKALALADVTGKLAEEASRAAEVVKRLRNFFRDRATELQPTALQPFLDEAMRAQTARALALNVRLTWSCTAPEATVWLDPVQIGVVVRNLLANALDAAAEPVQGSATSAWVKLEAIQEGADLVVAVTDSARGLHGQEADLVFERRRSGKPGGMGVGLAISRSIIEAHGGRLWAEPGPGGRFLFTLPLGSPAAS
ncbi:MAG: MASE1 domain-containing protein [Ramlibacter sp.]|nr:MASE1 domain-containing protein [Ramlibacter sp.]